MKIDKKYMDVIESLIKNGINSGSKYFTNLSYMIPDSKEINDKVFVPNFLFWDPLGQNISNLLQCPHCKEDGLKSWLKNSEQWDVGQSKSHYPRALWDDGWYCALVGKMYHCKNNHSINSYHAGIIDQIPIENVPFMLTFKTGVTKSLFHRIIRNMEVGVSFSGMENMLSGNFIDECYRRAMQIQESTTINLEHWKKSFGSFAPSDYLLRQCFVLHYESYKQTYQDELDKIPFESLSLDHTFKVATNIGYWKDQRWIKVYDSLFILLNEEGCVKAYKFTKGTALENVKDLLIKIKQQGEPQFIYVDNCCSLRPQLLEIFPEANIKLDVFHAVQRLTKTISKKHIFCSEFSKQIGFIFRAKHDIEEKRKKATATPEIILTNLEELIEEWEGTNYKGWKIVNENFLAATNNLKKHIENYCLSSIAPGQGTNRNENLHKNLKSILKSKKMGIQTANALMAHVIYLHNEKRKHEKMKINKAVPPIWVLRKKAVLNNFSTNAAMESTLLAQSDFVYKEIDNQWQGENETDHSYGSNTACK